MRMSHKLQWGSERLGQARGILSKMACGRGLHQAGVTSLGTGTHLVAAASMVQ